MRVRGKDDGRLARAAAATKAAEMLSAPVTCCIAPSPRPKSNRAGGKSEATEGAVTIASDRVSLSWHLKAPRQLSMLEIKENASNVSTQDAMSAEAMFTTYTSHAGLGMSPRSGCQPLLHYQHYQQSQYSARALILKMWRVDPPC
ncbi:hypothetical protein VTN96DRAFT_1556 [Rasamsonia emersonii]